MKTPHTHMQLKYETQNRQITMYITSDKLDVTMVTYTYTSHTDTTPLSLFPPKNRDHLLSVY